MTLTHDEFIRRFLLHVLPSGFHRIRHYGLTANTGRKKNLDTLHFRQILGRILRMTNSKNNEAILYMPAEPKLLAYAYRVKQDVPFEADVVKFEKMKGGVLDGV